MVTRAGGTRRKTRFKLQKSLRQRGKISIKDYYQPYEVDDKVIFKAEPAVQKGMFNAQVHGKTGIISGKRGNCYIVEYKDGSKQKQAIVHPVHLKRLS